MAIWGFRPCTGGPQFHPVPSGGEPSCWGASLRGLAETAAFSGGKIEDPRRLMLVPRSTCIALFGGTRRSNRIPSLEITCPINFRRRYFEAAFPGPDHHGRPIGWLSGRRFFLPRSPINLWRHLPVLCLGLAMVHQSWLSAVAIPCPCSASAECRSYRAEIGPAPMKGQAK